MRDSQEVEQAKAVLKENGYFVDNLWSVQDVKRLFRCTEEQAQSVLKKALTNEATMEQIQYSIREFAELDNLEIIVEGEPPIHAISDEWVLRSIL
jgi:hypothetical protein